jgi:hypothetical protein
MPPRPSTCLVCGTELSVLQARNGALCGRATCAWTHRSLPAHQRCGVCGRMLTTPEIARGACADPTCQRVWLVERPLAEREARRQALVSRAAAWRDASAVDGAVTDPAAFIPVPVPSNPYHTVPLPPSRREALREHLTEKATLALARRAAADPAELPPLPEPSSSAWASLPPPSPAMQRVLAQACAACRGSCCATGRNHAYIGVDTMLAYCEQHPDASLDEIVDAYLAHVASDTMSTGCVYQVEQACTLPRTMRSVICNGYYCESLVELQRVHQHDSPLRVFLAPDAQGQFDHGVFVAPALVTLVRRRAEEASDAVYDQPYD